VEILSRNDSLDELQERVNDYARMGVENVWAINPWKRVAYYATVRGFSQPEDGVLRIPGTQIEISLAEVFAELDEA
jgi:Uma2 family endonuclease